jgi:HSP20 family protein
MQSKNQTTTNLQGTETTTVKMVPVSSSVTTHGASVSYGIQGTSNVVPVNAGVTGVNTGFTNQFAWNNNYPSVSASQFNLLNSGSYNGNINNCNSMNLNNMNTMTRRSLTIQPSVDISETSSDIVVTAFVTNGVTNDLSLNVKEDSLTISGSVWTGNDTYIISRTVPLTTSVRAEAVDASLHSGVLEIRLPKTERK